MNKDVLELIEIIGIDRLNLSVPEQNILVNEGIDLDSININNGMITVPDRGKKDKKIFSIIPSKLYGETNEKNVPIYKMNEVIEMIQEILTKNGIVFDVRYEYLTSFEVNANINDKKLYDSIDVIAKANIFKNQTVFKAENGEGIQSLKIPKNKYTGKVYKKSEHLQEQGYDVEQEHLVRFEISTGDWTQKERLFGDDCSLNGLANNGDKVLEWFMVCIRETIKKPVEKYLKQLENECVDKLNAGVKPSQVINELMFTNRLVDLTVFDNAMKRHYKDSGKKKPQTVIKSTHNRLKKLNEDRYNQVVGNVESLERFYQYIGI